MKLQLWVLFAFGCCSYLLLLWYTLFTLPSVLWWCWLGGWKSIWPVKTWVMRCWCGYLSGARCTWLAYSWDYATVTPLSLLQQNPEWFILVRAYQDCPRNKAFKGLYVCVCTLSQTAFFMTTALNLIYFNMHIVFCLCFITIALFDSFKYFQNLLLFFVFS